MLELLTIKVAEIRVHELMLHWLPEDERMNLVQRRAVEANRRAQQRVDAGQQRRAQSRVGMWRLVQRLAQR